MQDISSSLAVVSKAIAGAIVSAIVGLVARFGFSPDEDAVQALEVLVTALISAVVGYLVVYWAPKNKGKYTSKK